MLTRTSGGALAPAGVGSWSQCATRSGLNDEHSGTKARGLISGSHKSALYIGEPDSRIADLSELGTTTNLVVQQRQQLSLCSLSCLLRLILGVEVRPSLRTRNDRKNVV